MKPKNTLTPNPNQICGNCMTYYYTDLVRGKESVALDAKEIETPCNGMCKFNPDSISKNYNDSCGRFVEYKAI